MYIINHPELSVSNFMGNSIGTKPVKCSLQLVISMYEKIISGKTHIFISRKLQRYFSIPQKRLHKFTAWMSAIYIELIN